MALVYTFAVIYGLCIGSFLNVVIYRLPRNMNLAFPGSHCTNCDYSLRWYDNIPVISYIILGGKCRKCKAHISFRYTAVEILNAVLWTLSAAVFWKRSPLYAIAVALFCSILICIAFIDLETMYIHDILVLTLLVPAVMATISGIGGNVWSHLIGMGVGGGFFLFIFLLARLVFKKDGLGVGDILLMAASGAFLGWKALMVAIFIASIVGCVVLVPIQLCGKKEKFSEYPFAPFLCMGTVAAVFVTEPLLSWYLRLFAI